MKVCLVTYSHSFNYGAALQLFATYKYLERQGCTVEVLNYQNPYEAGKCFSSKKKEPIKTIKNFISGTILGSNKNGRNNFSSFYDSMTYSETIYSIEDVEKIKEVDLFVVGSDQVWNPIITDGFDDVFCLNSSKLGRKISYASSMGSVNFNKYNHSSLIEGLKRFSHISVRETVAKTFIQSSLGNEVDIVIDPTMLFSKDEWISLLGLNTFKTNIADRYILIYALGNSFEELNKIAKRIAHDLGAKTAVITLSNRPKDVDYLINKASPLMFAKLVKEAAFIVTNSFHGTCFSLLFERPFYSVVFNSNPTRSMELLTRFGLSSRICKSADSIRKEHYLNDDIRGAATKIDEFRRFSKNWLNNAIWR